MQVTGVSAQHYRFGYWWKESGLACKQALLACTSHVFKGQFLLVFCDLKQIVMYRLLMVYQTKLFY